MLEDRTVPATTFTVKNLNNLGLDSLRQAIIDANALPGDDVIIFTGGLTGTIQLASALPDLTSNIDIQGPGASVLTVARGSTTLTPDFRIFTVAQNTTVALSGLTLTNGSDPLTGGGGIRNSGRLTLTHCTLFDNRTAAGSGGGIANIGRLTVTNCTLSANQARFGGGIANAGILTVANSTLSANRADQNGGGLFNGSSLFSAGVATLTNTTLTANRAASGGGIHFDTFLGLLTLHNTLVAGNLKFSDPTRDDVFGVVEAASSFNLIGDGTGLSGISDGSNGNQVGSPLASLDLRLGPLQDNGGPTFTHALLPGSRAIDNGQGLGAPPTDQRGLGRNGAPDIGSFEAQLQQPGTPSPPPALPPQIVSPIWQKDRGRVRVLDPTTGTLRAVLTPFRGFRGRLALQLRDVNGDGVLDLIVKAVVNGKRKRKVYDAVTLTRL